MKLAEALIKRKNLKGALSQLIERMKSNARVQEGDSPQESPGDTLQEIRNINTQIKYYTVRINRTNELTPFKGYFSLAEALAYREAIAREKNVVGELIEALKTSTPRWGRMEVKFETTVDPKAVLAEHKILTDMYQELDARIQAGNWNIDLLDME